MKSWKKQNPDFRIVLLTKENYRDYVYIDPKIANHPRYNDCIQRFSDLIRLFVLEKNGGYWIDASILLRVPLSELLFRSKEDKEIEISMFYLRSQTTIEKYPIIENWMFGCVPKCRFMTLWKNEFLEINNFETPDDYVESRKKMGVDLQNLVVPNYLTMHVGAQKIFQIDQYPLDKFEIHPAEDGPYLYLTDANWTYYQAVENACNQPKYKSLKMRGAERHYLDQNLEKRLTNEKCKWI